MPERFGRIDEEFPLSRKIGPAKATIRRKHAIQKPELYASSIYL
jgi:hypothetical protein